jgi:hypothetical protein
MGNIRKGIPDMHSATYLRRNSVMYFFQHMDKEKATGRIFK